MTEPHPSGTQMGARLDETASTVSPPDGGRAVHGRVRARPLARWVQRITEAPLFYALVAVAGLAVGRMLTPDGRGFGTHEALGLPPCLFRTLTGLPCPGCGMTTAVSHAAHGEFLQSFLAQPAGFLVGVGLWVAVPFLLVAAVRGVPLQAALPRTPRHPLGWGVVLLPIMLLAWGYKIWIVIAGF